MSTTQSKALATRNGPSPALNVSDPVALGEVLAASGYFQDARDAAKAAVKVMAGQELGFGPIASMTGVHIIQGAPSVGANLMAALVKRSPKYRYVITDHTDERCEIAFYERIADEWLECGPPSVFTMADAQKAKVAEKDNWKKFPRNMLFARAMSNGVTFYCADLTGGAPLYTPEELGADVDGETGEILPPQPEITEPPLPEPEPSGDGEGEDTITKAKAQELVDFAWAIGVDDKLRLAASHTHGDDVGDCKTKTAAVEALRKLTQPQADKVQAWLNKKADE